MLGSERRIMFTGRNIDKSYAMAKSALDYALEPAREALEHYANGPDRDPEDGLIARQALAALDATAIERPVPAPAVGPRECEQDGRPGDEQRSHADCHEPRGAAPAAPEVEADGPAVEEDSARDDDGGGERVVVQRDRKDDGCDAYSSPSSASRASAPVGERRGGEVARMLAEFHRVFAHPDDTPASRRACRERLHEEEHAELMEALKLANATPETRHVFLRALARELADVVYVAYGTAHAYEINLDAALREVHRANMSKLGPDGEVLQDEHGKVIKGPNFQPPDMTAALAASPPPTGKTASCERSERGTGGPNQADARRAGVASGVDRGVAERADAGVDGGRDPGTARGLGEAARDQARAVEGSAAGGVDETPPPIQEGGRDEVKRLRDALAYYANEESYNEDGAPVYTDLSPPEGWVGESYEPEVRLDEGRWARQALDDDLHADPGPPDAFDAPASQPPVPAGGDLAEENRVLRGALEELAANRHSFHLPAGQIAREALDAVKRGCPCAGTAEQEDCPHG